MRRYARATSNSYDLQAARDHIVWYHQMIDLLTQQLPHIVRVKKKSATENESQAVE